MTKIFSFLLEELVVKLEAEVRRPSSECLGDEACEHQLFPEKWVANDSSKDHKAKQEVGTECLKDRCEAQGEHESSYVPVRRA